MSIEIVDTMWYHIDRSGDSLIARHADPVDPTGGLNALEVQLFISYPNPPMGPHHHEFWLFYDGIICRLSHSPAYKLLWVSHVEDEFGGDPLPYACFTRSNAPQYVMSIITDFLGTHI